MVGEMIKPIPTFSIIVCEHVGTIDAGGGAVVDAVINVGEGLTLP